MFASLPLYIVTTLFAFRSVSAFPRVYKHVPRIVSSVPNQDPGILRSVPKQDPRSANALSTFDSSSIKDCPPFWESFGKYCYAVRGTHKTWDEARSRCKEKGGDLVTIKSFEENNYVLNMTKMAENPKIWIGLKSGLHWDDYTAPKYTNWASGEPDGQSTKPCVWMYGPGDREGFWKAGPCEGDSIGTVCKRLP